MGHFVISICYNKFCYVRKTPEFNYNQRFFHSNRKTGGFWGNAKNILLKLAHYSTKKKLAKNDQKGDKCTEKRTLGISKNSPVLLLQYGKNAGYN